VSANWLDEPVPPSVRVPGLGAVTRFEVTDATGRAMVRYGVSVEVHVQDEGRTLKVFLTDREDEA
jgi:hypothetical protein